MRQPLVVAFGIAVVIVAAVVGAVLYMQKGAHLELEGKILKVRTAPLDENNSVAVLDFRLTDISDVEFDVRQVTVTLEDRDGKTTGGITISASDTEHLFQNLPLLGEKYNPVLIARNRIAPHATADYMVAVAFSIPQNRLEARKSFTISVDEVDGVVSQIK
ncbi:MAG: hypothetical protein JO323_07450 [Acidobacteriia bacterium]|nr:hypothetical protein [Terriglobia bacterium]